MMRQPSAELPPQERLGDYLNHYVVFTDQRWDKRDTKRGPSRTVECLAYVFLDGAWKDLGETPVFWLTVQQQIMADDTQPLGGKLVQGTERNGLEYVILPVPADDEVGTAALDSWDPDTAGDL